MNLTILAVLLLQPVPVQAGTVQAGTVQAGTVQAGTVQAVVAQASTAQAEPDRVHECPPSLAPHVPRVAAATPTLRCDQRSDAFQPGWNIVSLGAWTAEERTRIARGRQADAGRRHRLGLVRAFANGPIDLSSPALRPNVADDDSIVWTIEVTSPDSFGLRLHFSNLDLEPGAQLVVYGRDRNGTPVARGPYEGRGPLETGELWTPWVPGESAWVEITSESPPLGLLVDALDYDRSPAGVSNDDTALNTQGGGPGATTLNCHLDATCFTTPGNMSSMLATTRIDYVEGGSGFLCSGTLLADQDSGANGHYYLTAEHCISDAAAAATIEFIWFWQSTSCNTAPTVQQFNLLPRTCGAFSLASDGAFAGNDTSFLRMAQPPPAGAMYAGWTTADMPTTAYGFHHPGGSFKRYTEWIDSWHIFCQFWDSAYYHFTERTIGTMEGGSSGSALFNSSGKVLGQLYGWCGDGPDCTPDGWRGLYGEFENTYVLECDVGPWEVRDWLEIGATLTIDANASSSNDELGTSAEPFMSIGPAYGTIWNGGRLRFRPGTYSGSHLFEKQLELFAVGEANAVIGG